ncbi:MBL fold metallo-hydrolase [Mycobacterium sp. Y57]|uniref:MBL fold metallo-hydrolase n=1 Tax=Mycolicibacterium xanthum TaxID=2796469 RepID=UPI001C8449CE|nr:MBL fold metallo-hydrolase [Mycolicibacterium xanthum]MBX7433163.1 MBL fold metallo-hydrolase [Mycolicibacterium xanthum]
MADAGLAWEQLTPQVFRCRLAFCDVTVGLVAGGGQALLIDTGTTLAEAEAVAADVRSLTGHEVGHVVLTHNHFDHILGSSVFAGARFYCATAVLATMATAGPGLRAEAVRYGADAAEVDRAVAALAPPRDAVGEATLRLGALDVAISHPGRGHTDHDLIVAVAGAGPTVVFCGDLVEESGDPCFDEQSDPAQWPSTLRRVIEIGGESALYVPGHGAVVDADFVRRQAMWLAGRS